MTSCTSVDLPDPLTPVTHVSVSSGIATSMSFRLCSAAPEHAEALARCRAGARPAPGSTARRAGTCAVSDRGSLHQALERSRVDHLPALLAGAEPEVDDVVGDADHVGVVLDHEHRVALVAQLPQDRDQPPVVARVQADRRLVEHVERADQRRPERGRQVDPLRLAARQRRRQPVERQVVEADVAQESEPAADLRAAPCRRSPRRARRA